MWWSPICVSPITAFLHYPHLLLFHLLFFGKKVIFFSYLYNLTLAERCVYNALLVIVITKEIDVIWH